MADGRGSVFDPRSSILGLREHGAELLLIGLRHQGRALQSALALTRLAREDVRPEGVAPLELSRSGLLEALGRAPVCLQLRHDYFASSFTSLGGAPLDSPPRCALGAPLRGAPLRPSLAAAGASLRLLPPLASPPPAFSRRPSATGSCASGCLP